MSKTFSSHEPRQARPARAGVANRGGAPRRNVTRDDLDSAAAAKLARPSADESRLKPTRGAEANRADADNSARKKEIGGPEGPEPTRFGDWERKGICYDF